MTLEVGTRVRITDALAHPENDVDKAVRAQAVAIVGTEAAEENIKAWVGYTGHVVEIDDRLPWPYRVAFDNMHFEAAFAERELEVIA